MDAPPLILGLSIADVSIGGSGPNIGNTGDPTPHPVERAFAASKPTFLVSWPVKTDGKNGLALAAGCEDGSTFIFWPSKPVPPPPNAVPTATGSTTIHSPHPQVASSVSARVLKSPSPTPSRTSTRATSLLAHSHPPSIIAPRSPLVTSGLSKAQVEAPKTFVDYDDEPEYLRSMLKTNRTDGGAVRRSVSDKVPSSSASSSPSTVVEEIASPAAQSPLVTSPTLPPPLPSVSSFRQISKGDSAILQLKFRLLPPRTGFGHGVASLKLLEGSSILACLQECGTISLYALSDGRCIASARIDEFPRIKPPSGCKVVPEVQGFFKWQSMRVAQDGQSTLLFLAGQDASSSASPPDTDDTASFPDLRIAVVRVHSPYERAFTSAPDEILDKVGDWISDGSALCVGLHLDAQGDLSIYRVNRSLHLILQSVQFLPHPPSPSPPPARNLQGNDSSSFLPLPLSQSFTQLQQQFKLPNPFKSSSHGRRRSGTYRFSRHSMALPIPFASIAEENLEQGRVELSDEFDAGLLEWDSEIKLDLRDVGGLALATLGPKVMGCVWTEEQCCVFRLGPKREPLRIVASTPADGAQNVMWLDPSNFAVTTPEALLVFNIKSTDANNDLFKDDSWFSDPAVEVLHRIETTITIPCDGTVSSTLISPSLLVISAYDLPTKSSSLATITLPKLSSKADGTSPKARYSTRKPSVGCKSLWRLLSPSTKPNPLKITSVLPLGFDLIVLGLADGTIAKATLDELIVQRHVQPGHGVKASKGLSAPILSLDHIKNSRTGERYVLGSAYDGSLAIWTLQDLELRSRWTAFSTPLQSVIDLTEEDNVGRLKDCLLCVSEHGTVAVILIDGLELLYLIPGSSAPLERICLGEDNLLLIYADAKARLWDIKTQEFWRSMTKAKAEDLLEQGGWFEVFVRHDGPTFAGERASFGCARNTSGDSNTIFMDCRELIRTGLGSITAPPKEDHETNKPDLESTLVVRAWKYLHPILAGLLTISLDSDFDELCLGLLGTALTGQSPLWSVTGFKGAIAFPSSLANMEGWKISPEYTSTILLAILSLLKAASAFEEWDSLASQISIYLTSNLHEIVGEGYKPPSLEVLTGYWFDPCVEIKQAARHLFTASVQRYSDKEACSIIENWRHRLPSVQPDNLKDAPYSAVALIVVGHVAIEHYASIPTETLTDIAKSVDLYLHDESSPHRVLAIELCSIGFHVWQHYVDAVNVLRALFTLATNAVKKESAAGGGSGNVGPQARAAVLQIASTNTPLFMTTLSMDIANPTSLEHRKSVMQLIAFIIRKKPLVLYPNLTRLVEAVIKSLDPTSAANREAVMDPAVEILGHVVRTFPTVDFHKATQRLALGTNEGAVIMYDLKTATRLYVLEGHKKRLTAVSFSPDGRRLVTASLDESVVMVWKVGSSFSSFFNPGAPPRQGGAGSEAYKVLPFNVGDEARMTVASTLDWVAFEWPNERTARLKIRDSALTFST